LGVLGLLSFTNVWLMNFDTRAVLWCFALLPTVLFFLMWGICGYLVVWRKWPGALPILVLWLSGVFHFLKAIDSYEFSPASFVAYVSVSLVTGVVLVWRKLTSELNKFPDRYHGEVEPVSNAKHGTIGTYRVLSPGYRPAPGFGKVAQRYRSLPGAFLIATIGWSYWNLLFGDMNSFMLPMLIVIVIGLVAMGMFVFDRYPNLGFAARWSRRQFIVPAYDRVWLIFLSVVAAGGAILLAGKVGIVGPSVSGPTGIAVALFVALRSGKDQEEWSFTAPCRHKLAKLQKTVT
ncbi:MAG: hypothetical protein AB8G99_11575, partial [Planctomycetaceae bacterium]